MFGLQYYSRGCSSKSAWAGTFVTECPAVCGLNIPVSFISESQWNARTRRCFYISAASRLTSSEG
jgi:hypothetical protein